MHPQWIEVDTDSCKRQSYQDMTERVEHGDMRVETSKLKMPTNPPS